MITVGLERWNVRMEKVEEEVGDEVTWFWGESGEKGIVEKNKN